MDKVAHPDPLKDAQDKIVAGHDGLMKSVSNYFMQQLTPKNQNYQK